MLSGELRMTHFPYCLKRQEDGSHVVLNRNYKPIGFMTGERVNYADYPVGVKIKGIGPKTAAQLDWQGRDNTDEIFLYNDGCIPTADAKSMQAYLARLAKLMALKTEVV